VAATSDLAPARARGSLRGRHAALRYALRRAALYVLAVLVGAVLMIPFAWAIDGSLKPETEIRLLPPKLLPSKWMFSNYPETWHTTLFAQWAQNSVFVVVLATVGGVLSAAAAGYAFARFRFPGRTTMFALTLGTLMLPQEVTLIPSYLLFFKLHWLNTYLPLIVPSWFGGGAFLIFLFRQFFLTIPLDLDDAAKIDGASYFQILGWIILPLSRPVLATAAILTFIGNWNSFLFPLIVLNDAAKFTLSIGLRYFAVSPSADSQPTDHLLLAGSIMMTIPILLIFFFGQRYFIRGVVMSGVKG
jgi:multiple sugar transport system permease protein